MNRIYLWPITMALSFSTAAVHALEYGVVLSNESEYTTNTARTEDDEVEEWIHSPGVRLLAEHEGPSYELNVDYEFARRIYEEDLFDDDNEYTGTANAVWHAIPDRLDLVVDHVRTQSAIRAIAATTPANRQESTTTSAGPVLRFNPRGQDELEIQYLYIDRTAEESDVDSVTHESTGRYVLVSSPRNSFILEGINRQVQFEAVVFPDVEYNIGQLGWQRTGSQVTMTLLGGYSQAERTDDREDVDGFVGSLDLNWQFSSSTSLRILAARELLDRSESLGTGTFADELDFSVSSDIAEVFTNTRGTVALEHAFNATTRMTLSATYDEEDYDDVARDQESQTLSVTFARELNPRTSLQAGVRWGNQDFTDEGDETDLLEAEISIDRTFGQRITLGLSVDYYDRDSDSGLGSRSYDEWVAAINFRYQLLGTLN